MCCLPGEVWGGNWGSFVLNLAHQNPQTGLAAATGLQIIWSAGIKGLTPGSGTRGTRALDPVHHCSSALVGTSWWNSTYWDRGIQTEREHRERKGGGDWRLRPVKICSSMTLEGKEWHFFQLFFQKKTYCPRHKMKPKKQKKKKKSNHWFWVIWSTMPTVKYYTALFQTTRCWYLRLELKGRLQLRYTPPLWQQPTHDNLQQRWEASLMQLNK